MDTAYIGTVKCGSCQMWTSWHFADANVLVHLARMHSKSTSFVEFDAFVRFLWLFPTILMELIRLISEQKFFKTIFKTIIVYIIWADWTHFFSKRLHQIVLNQTFLYYSVYVWCMSCGVNFQNDFQPKTGGVEYLARQCVW